MRKAVAVARGLAGLGASPGPANAQSPQEWKCTGGPDIPWDEQVVGCTNVIRSGRYSGEGLSWAYRNRGNAWLAKADTGRANADYTDAIKLDPKNARAYYNRGIAWRTKGDFERAIADYTEAIKLDPKYTSAYNNRGLVWDAKGDADRAIADLNEAIKLDPGLANAAQKPR